ncbi:hypothetical protein SDRG_02437 [Saprolegnia diclina VS20]|uniref:F-box domain-containing protein n=1 Tax=Saprolegnia diclina (strain VS20) TaxID=1156394 RepID=T0SCK4_SAPDV|nr:hypothetical protein SDRG_02437 [Saprolegnia diclina VS20]EQC40547.1 hypothetical protein SDRG_02437 [Saprolegnia diclina VS20]|eukprot:XP_008606246.1 hypothetical protein SDRG_02437 [Saprolegnia diclina VS20]
MSRPRGNPEAVGSTPELLQHIATFVQHGPTLLELAGALPPAAMSPGIAALSALCSTPTVHVAWPRISVLGTTSEATKQHLANIDALGAIVSDAAALGSALAACPRLRMVTTLRAEATKDFAAIAEIFAHMPLGQLTELTMRGQYPASVASAVAAMLAQGRCRRLHLVDTTFNNASIEDVRRLCEAIASCDSLHDLVLKNDSLNLDASQNTHDDMRFKVVAHTLRSADTVSPEQCLVFQDGSAADIARFRTMLLNTQRLTHVEERLLVHVANDRLLQPCLGRLTSLCMPLSGVEPDVWPVRFLEMLPHLGSLKQLELQHATVHGDFQRELALGLGHCTQLQYLDVAAPGLYEAMWLAQLPCPKLNALRVRFRQGPSKDLVRLVKTIAVALYSLRWLCLEKVSWPKPDRARNIKTLAADNVTLEYIARDVDLTHQRRTYNYWDAKSTGHKGLVVFAYEE